MVYLGASVFKIGNIKEKPALYTALKDFLALSLTKCLDIVHARSGSIFLLKEDKKELVLEVAQNPRGLNLEGMRQKIGEGIVGGVALRKTPLLIKDVEDVPLFRESLHVTRYQTKSFLFVPLEYSGDILGVINITDRESGESFDKDDLVAIFNICKCLGIAIYNLKKYFEAQEKIQHELKLETEELKLSLERTKNFSSLGKLAGGLVHELNNPLDGIIRYVNLALERTDRDAIVHEYLLEAKQGLNRIANTIKSLLDFSWNLSCPNSFIDINRAIEECLFVTGEYFSAYSIKVHKKLSQNLPPVPDYRLKMVFNNIIKNAYTAMGKKGGNLTITTALKSDCIEITFADTGPGIPEDIQNKIFEPFFTTKKIGEGSGLGLAICYEAIQRYKGTIRVESKVNKGATFIIQLPLPLEANSSHETLKLLEG